MQLGHVRVVVNPAAGSGAAGRKIPEIARALARAGVEHEIAETRRPGDATALTRRASDEGADVVAVVGGDGTLNEVAQAYLGPDGAVVPGPDLALIPAGTGGDFRRTFGLTGGLDEAVERLIGAEPRPLDLGVLELVDDAGARVKKAFINITSFGIGGLTDRIVNAGPKWVGGRVAFFLGSLRATLSYKSAPVRVKVDGKTVLEAPILNVAIANGRYFGGGMMIAPDADPSDGLFDVVALYDMTRAQGIALAAKIYRGSHTESPGVRVSRGSVVHAEPLHPWGEVLIDMDGETPGRLPLEARVAAGALGIRA
jgi:YegS/Rv2252/BmrU family lipid kinase